MNVLEDLTWIKNNLRHVSTSVTNDTQKPNLPQRRGCCVV